jgi:AraC-like DNA-binding protein
MFRVVTPFSLLITPAGYVYTRSVLKGELKFRRSDWWLLVPTLLYAINLIPHYSLSNLEKIDYLERIYKNKSLQSQLGDGIFPAYVFPLLRVVWLSLFIIKSYRLITQFKKQSAPGLVNDNKMLLRWLEIFTGLMAGLLLTAFASAIIAPFIKSNLAVLDFALGITIIVICVQLFIRPKLLYGIYHPGFTYYSTIEKEIQLQPIRVIDAPIIHCDENSMKAAAETDRDMFISKSDAIQYKKKVEDFFNEQQPFLNPHYSLDLLVSDTYIVRNTLSAFINRQYGMGFREFLNRYRVNYFKEHINNPNWKNLTLEAISAECGFTSRSTFIKNFKKISGQTPSEYIKQINDQSMF